MRSSLRLLPLLAIVFPVVSGAPEALAPSATITVIGQADPSVDRQNIQGALDAARNNDTVELVGDFQLDGTRMFLASKQLSIIGRVVDNDGDGAVNEDWADGVDNDGDGAVDEDDWDATLTGIANPDGTPAGAVPVDDPFNRGFSLEGLRGAGHHITIKNLKLSTFLGAINISPDVRFDSSRCGEVVPTRGIAHHLVVENNWFDNNGRAVQVIGNVHHYRISDNLFTRINASAVLTQGENVFCRLPDGSAIPVLVGVPASGDISHNRVLGGVGAPPGGQAFRIGFSARTEVWNNEVDSLRDGIRIVAGSDNYVFNNSISNATNNGMIVLEPSSGTVMARNVITNSFIGIAFRGGASLYRAIGNDITLSRGFDILLDGTTANNTVDITEFPVTVVDLGTGNTILQ